VSKPITLIVYVTVLSTSSSAFVLIDSIRVVGACDSLDSPSYALTFTVSSAGLLLKSEVKVDTFVLKLSKTSLKDFLSLSLDPGFAVSNACISGSRVENWFCISSTFFSASDTT